MKSLGSRHGVLSKHTVLPWEDACEYHALVDALAKEHAPRGPTEEHLVEELAGVLWRKRRLRMAELSAFRQGLEGTLTPYGGTVKAALVHLDDPEECESSRRSGRRKPNRSRSRPTCRRTRQ
jgi:hypothetical protein